MRPPAKPRPRSETWAGVVILLVLAGIAGALYVQQSHFHPAILAAGSVSPADARTPAAPVSSIVASLPAGLGVLTAPEKFSPDSLSDKIDGKAELYLAAGFVGLQCQRFAPTGHPQDWLEMFVYDMGSLPHAFAVYSVQRRAEAPDAGLGTYSYKTANALFFIQGRFYVELIAAVDSEALVAQMTALARQYIAGTPVPDATLAELTLFPEANLQKSSFKLLPQDAFGFAGLDNVFTADYRMGTNPVTAFVSLRQTPPEASALAAAYARFLSANGGVAGASAVSIPGLKTVTILETHELIFTMGRVLAGIHGAENQDAAEQLAVALARQLEERKP